MLELNGKYNTCKVFTNNVDNETISQLISLLNLESVKDSKIRIMPDTHAGKGCVIGTTMTLTDKVIPNLVGCDIGCGMLAIQLEEKEIDFKILDEVIRKYVPSGFEIHEFKAIATSPIEDIFAPIDVDRAYKSLGTLGGGNHFIEIDRSEKTGDLWLVIHTGSRHLGIEVCDYYQKLAYKNIKRNNIASKIKRAIERLKSEGREREIESVIKKIKAQETPIPKDLCHIEGEDFKNYIHDMKLVQEYARINRATIAAQMLKYAELHEIDRFDTIHNYVDTDNMILRKGSISAQEGERVLIPLNMRDGSLICIGKGNPDWNYSAPHGAGRIMSRGKAKETISIDAYKRSMADIYSTCVNESTIDESPYVYKPMEEIIKNIEDTVKIADVITPIYNFKASS